MHDGAQSHRPLPNAERPPRESAADWRLRLHSVIFETGTPAGKAYDVLLLLVILASILLLMLDTVPEINARHHATLDQLEWLATIFLTVDYFLRLVSVRKLLRYATSAWGVIDLLSFLPAYVSLLVPGLGILQAVRVLRLLRVFRVFKMADYVHESNVLWRALWASRHRVVVFLTAVLTLVVIIGTAMYEIESPESGFTSIPISVYWAIVTLTTVGYGDIAPATPLGSVLASIVMLLGYAIIIVPAGIVGAEMARSATAPVSAEACPACAAEGHDADAKYCKRCGAEL